jgi:hypothetical protein
VFVFRRDKERSLHGRRRLWSYFRLWGVSTPVAATTTSAAKTSHPQWKGTSNKKRLLIN